MKCTIPEISWHNKDPVLSIDIQPSSGDEFYRLASGGTDSHILIWHLREQVSGIPTLECVSDLTRHQKAVNVVRFSPSGNLLASGDDESVIIVWKRKTDQDPVEFPDEQEVKNQEQWVVFKILRGHLEDIYDLSWSADENNIISGSVDNTAIIWDVKKGRMKDILRDHKSFVQGVAWDPAGQLLTTLSSDRICRIYNVSNRKIISRIGKAILPGSKPDAKPVHLFHDDTLKSFFRRLCFSPCGSLLIAPAGIIEPQEPGQKAVNTTLIFSKNSLSRPVAYLPSYNQYSVAVRCCPKLFALRDTKEPSLFNLPYRVVFAIATQCSVILYDTQHNCPFAFITNIHYTRLTDLTWSNDGKILIVSSTDGYCSIITFCDNELGEPYVPSKELETDTTNKEKKAQESTKLKLNSKTESNETHNLTPEKSYNLSSRNKSSTKKVNQKSSKSEKELKGSPVPGSSLVNVKDESVVDDTSDYCLILEDTVNDSVNAKEETSISEKRDTDKTEKELENKNESEKSDCSINSSFSEVTKANEKLVKGKEESLKKVVPSVDSSVNVLPVVSEKENLNVVSENNFITPSKDSSKSVKLSSPVTSADTNRTCTPPHITPIEQRKPKRAQLITLSSPKSKKKL